MYHSQKSLSAASCLVPTVPWPFLLATSPVTLGQRSDRMRHQSASHAAVRAPECQEASSSNTGIGGCRRRLTHQLQTCQWEVPLRQGGRSGWHLLGHEGHIVRHQGSERSAATARAPSSTHSGVPCLASRLPQLDSITPCQYRRTSRATYH